MADGASRPIYRDLLDPNATNTRQDLIKKIQEILGAKLVTYIANDAHPISLIMHQDVILFEDLLRSISTTKKGVLMINSPGGDPNTAEKLMLMCRNRFTEGFTVIVPNYAKSAATMICLGSDKILMGYMAELGPIDPQLQLGPGASVPARSFIDGIENIRQKVHDGDPPSMYVGTLSRIRPEVIAICLSSIEDARQTAEK
jgi:ClpP class serine protease